MFDLEKIAHGKQLTEVETKVLQYILDNFDTVLKMGVRNIAKENYTSTSTIMRLTKKLGYDGFIDMHYKLSSHLSEQTTTLEKTEILEFFSTKDLLLYNDYEDIKTIAKTIYNSGNKIIFFYATGLSSLLAEYFYKKLLILGKKSLFSTGSDSAGVFINNLEDIGAFITVSKTGQTPYVVDKAITAKENNVFTISFTNEVENQLGKNSDINIKIKDTSKYDDRNTLPNSFFPNMMMIFEIIIYEYHQLILENDELQ